MKVKVTEELSARDQRLLSLHPLIPPSHFSFLVLVLRITVSLKLPENTQREICEAVIYRHREKSVQDSMVLLGKGGANGKQLTLALGCFLEALPGLHAGRRCLSKTCQLVSWRQREQNPVGRAVKNKIFRAGTKQVRCVDSNAQKFRGGFSGVSG